MNDKHRKGRRMLFTYGRYIILTVLTLVIIKCGKVARAQENKAVDITSKGIQIGERVPDVTITNLHNYPLRDSFGVKSKTAKISDFKGKLLILDFWATWCSPCVAMIPKMDSLQRVFGNKVQFLSVTYQPEKEVLPFMQKLEKQRGRQFALPLVTGEKQLHRLFPHMVLPHYVWIDGSGIVKAITGYEEVNAAVIDRILQGGAYSGGQKRDFKVAYNLQLPFIEASNGISTPALRYHAVLAAYTPGLTAGYDIINKDTAGNFRMAVRNMHLSRLYRLAFGRDEYIGFNRMVLQVKDSTAFIARARGAQLREWSAKHCYNYELSVPAAIGHQAHEMMLQDLNRLFPQYAAQMEPRKVTCLVLKQHAAASATLASRGGVPYARFSAIGAKMVNTRLSRLVAQLKIIYLQRLPYPLLDETGCNGNVDINLQADLTDWQAINTGLKPYGLRFELAEREIPMLVIRDAIH